jgi:hypothetical protein
VLRLLLSFAKTLSDSLRSILDPSITVMMLYFFVGTFLDDVSTILITVPRDAPAHQQHRLRRDPVRDFRQGHVHHWSHHLPTGLTVFVIQASHPDIPVWQK